MTYVTPPTQAPSKRKLTERRASALRRNIEFSWTSGLLDLRKRFQDSLIGGSWLILAPLLLASVYWIVFDKIVGIEFRHPTTGETVPFLAAFSVGFFLYLTLSELLINASGWLKGRRRYILESDLPTWPILASLAARVFIQFLGYLAVVIAICLIYGLVTPLGVTLYIAASLVIFIMFVGISIIVAYVGAYFGDIREVLPILMRVLFYSSAITFPLTLVPDELRWIPLLNPLTWPVELMRDLLIWGAQDPVRYILPISSMFCIVWAVAAVLHIRLANRVSEVL